MRAMMVDIITGIVFVVLAPHTARGDIIGNDHVIARQLRASLMKNVGVNVRQLPPERIPHRRGTGSSTNS